MDDEEALSTRRTPLMNFEAVARADPDLYATRERPKPTVCWWTCWNVRGASSCVDRCKKPCCCLQK